MASSDSWRPRFVIFTSYGNDSAALIQWAHEQELTDVAVVYSDTKWGTADWRTRVDIAECWVLGLGFRPFRTTSIGFAELARQKKGFPTQRYQWCSYVLKIEPGARWLAEHDPEKRAVCLVGVRREESRDRENFPRFLVNSANHGGRTMIAPLADYTETDRDVLLQRANIEVLPHRSRECKCINARKADIQRFTPDDIADIKALETEIGRPLYRPHRHLGATGIDEMVKWAASERGGYMPPEREEDILGCDTFGACA